MPSSLSSFKAPSRHSGDNSLSPKEPSSSDTSISANSGGEKSRMSLENIWTSTKIDIFKQEPYKMNGTRTFLWPQRLYHIGQCAYGAGILLNDVDAHLAFCYLGSIKHSTGQGTTSTAKHHYDRLQGWITNIIWALFYGGINFSGLPAYAWHPPLWLDPKVPAVWHPDRVCTWRDQFQKSHMCRYPNYRTVAAAVFLAYFHNWKQTKISHWTHPVNCFAYLFKMCVSQLSLISFFMYSAYWDIALSLACVEIIMLARTEMKWPTIICHSLCSTK